MPSLKQKPASQLLIVDDDPSVQELLSRWLGAAGYQVARADCLAMGWDYVNEHPVDLVTLDIRMPGGSGLELLDLIKPAFPDMACLMLTGEADSSAAIRALTHGASGYLVKPVEREELLIHVQNALEMCRLVIENREHLRHLENRVREQTGAIRQAHEETIHRLVTVSQFRDEETGAHIRRAGLYCELLAATAGWTSERVDQIRLAAPMHDVGKIGIPDAILRKPGKLTTSEFAIMQTHAELGAQMLSGSESPVLQMAQEIALCHHERWDGMGYPSGLAGCEIPEAARMVAIVDVYDALSHKRVYKSAMSEKLVLATMLDGRGKHFDPRLLDIFMSLLPEMRAIALAIPDEEEAASLVWSPAGAFAVPGRTDLR